MEDDSETRDGAGDAPESLLPYDQWTEDALRGVVVRALRHAAAEGLPGGHHFYITFRTDYPGVVIPARLRQKYPQEMTIVLQHQYENLFVDEAEANFGVSLSFGGVQSPLQVPLAAVSGFVDPHVQFGLRFRVAKPAPALVAPEPEEPTEPGETPQVVSLDAFRRKRD
jgi:hypothetical protein